MPPVADPDFLKKLYKHLLFPRMIEEKMLILLRQGKIGKWFSGIGQEAISVGATLAMEADEYILPMHRNLGVFTSRKVPLERLAGQFLGKASGFTKGRDRSFHFGSLEYRLVGMISHLGPQLGIADGIAMAGKLSGEGKATLVFTGEGASSEGDFHEALNVAAVWDLPVIFLIENNGYALSTPVSEQYRCEKLSDKGAGYGIEAVQIDGNDVMKVYQTVKKYAGLIRRSPRPVLIECMTFRMRGHEEASGTRYVPKALFTKWAEKDPVSTFEQYLLRKKVIDTSYADQTRARYKKEIEGSIAAAFEAPPVQVDQAAELRDVYASYVVEETRPAGKNISNIRYIDAVSAGLRQAMQKHQKLVLMGQDIAEYGGAFKITNGFAEEFGKERVRNTPLCESAIIGAAFGLSIAGYKALVEMQFADFVTMGFNQIVNNLAKSHYRWGQNADVVIRMPTGAGTGAGPFHSQSNEAWFVKTPGLKVVCPATPADAKGLLLAAVEDPDPVIYFEHKYLYRKISGPVPDESYTISIGKAKTVKEGTGLSIITYGLGVHWALEALKGYPPDSAEILDLRTLLPWDKQAVENAVKKTGKVLLLHEDTLTGGIGGEIAAWIAEHCFEYLDAPVMRCASLDTPVPMDKTLENNFLARSRLGEAIEKLMKY